MKNPDSIASAINTAVFDCHQNAKDKGWWEKPRSTIECLALVGCEVAEAIEDVRDGNTITKYAEDGKLNGLPSELADIVIRVFDLAGHLNVDLGKTIVEKHEYNKTRPHRHGGKLA